MNNPINWKVWFRVHKDPNWYTSSVVFANEELAIEHARAKFNSWTQADSWLAVEEGYDPNIEGVPRE